ncbi:MAG: AMP-binding protein, partial [Saprospiraceae bacterium]
MNKFTGKVATHGFHAQLCLHQIFAQRVEEQPTAIALIHREEQLTYAELDQKSTALAHHLLSLGLQSEQFVAICMDRSFEMLISIFAVLKAGGAYVPIDVDYPEERLRFMIEDSAAQIVLTQQSLVDKLPKTAKHIIPLEELNLEQPTVNSSALSKDTSPTTNYQLPTTNPEHLAYCIYT